MRRIAIALTLLLVAGCGQAARPYAPGEAAAESAAPKETATPEQSSPAQAERPADEKLPSGTQTIDVGHGLRIRVEWPADPHPALKPMVDQYVGTRKAVVEGKTIYKDGLEFDAAVQASEWVKSFVDEGWSMRGVGRIYNLRVAARMGRGAEVTACVDESGIRVVSSRTGKVISPQPDWLRTPYPQSVGVRRGDDGVWRMRMYATGRERCTR
ncbi:hypothetical protein [Nonomuraea sp. SYSU D8015]|uniref:hypothetical protein n=1 Tax=Nonomuraea sp. SYSU D8015 TaxID=2593644 RepID=UPI00166138EB|nr:hypothetical protein [Nonomuraea sp. SYSU D8015]